MHHRERVGKSREGPQFPPVRWDASETVQRPSQPLGWDITVPAAPYELGFVRFSPTNNELHRRHPWVSLLGTRGDFWPKIRQLHLGIPNRAPT